MDLRGAISTSHTWENQSPTSGYERCGFDALLLLTNELQSNLSALMHAQFDPDLQGLLLFPW